MSFPQTQASQATLRSQDYWRLFTEIETSGDIYRCDVSARAFVLGPQSDVARVKISYFDPQEPAADLANNLVVSNERLFSGRVDALQIEQYGGGDQQANILITLLDLMPPPGYQPEAAAAAGDEVVLVQPRLDLLAYLAPVPANVPDRVERQHLLQGRQSIQLADSIWYIVPFYGRKSVCYGIKNVNFALAVDVNLELWAIKFGNFLGTGVGGFPVGETNHQEVLVRSDGPIAPDSAISINQNLCADMIAVRVSPDGVLADPNQVSLDIRVSDKTTVNTP